MRSFLSIPLALFLGLGCASHRATSAENDPDRALSEQHDSSGRETVRYHDVRRALSDLTNEDIGWNANVIGAYPEFSADAQTILSWGNGATDSLIELLCDPNRFVAAHVLLSAIHEDAELENRGTWNGIWINFDRHGAVYYDSKDMSTVREFWHRWRREHPGD